MYFVQYFFVKEIIISLDEVRNQTLNEKYHIRVINIFIKKKIKSSSKEFFKVKQFKFSPMEKKFQKI